MSDEITIPPSEPGDVVELLVPGAERGKVARALLAAATEQGLPPEVVRSTSTGYKAPRAVADAADVALAASVSEPGALPGTQVFAAPAGKPGYRRQGQQPVDPDQVPEPELPEPVKSRGRRGAR